MIPLPQSVDEHEIGDVDDVKAFFKISKNPAYTLMGSGVPWARKIGGQYRVNLPAMREWSREGDRTCQDTGETNRGRSLPTFATSGAVGRRSAPKANASPQSVSVSSNWRAVSPAPTR
jgi:hypothetical protein